ncbi:MAG: protein translocase subunit SecF [candidate division WOR-3 bacterium]|nr:protein translocase subunit SecF [candidate division WOR-3 bacterium]
MLQIFKNADFKIVPRRYITFGISILLTILTIISIIVHKGLKYGVDFTGGTLLEIHFAKPIETQTLRNAFAKLSVGNVTIQNLGEGSDFIVRFESQMKSESAESTSANIIQLLQNEIPDNPAELVRIEMVGPRIGRELQRNALIAVLIGMVGILIYVSIRFDFRFGTAAVIALFHDVFTTIGFISITNTEISIPIIAALLTIIGYSVNNSIVISDRVRENLRRMIKAEFSTIINTSINQTLSRTTLTAFTTFIIAFVLYLFGAATIKDFAKVISFGIIIGTYSAIFIGAPLVAEWEKHFPMRRRR